jgi:glucans biosynthesis protein
VIPSTIELVSEGAASVEVDASVPVSFSRARPAAVAWVGAWLFASSQAAAAAEAESFDFAAVRSHAQALAQKPYQPPENKIPGFLLDLDYDAHRDIRFKPARSIWRDEGLPFQLQFFHLGLYFREPVRIHLIEGGAVRDFDFDASLFDYGKNRFSEPLPPDLGYAGFRVHSRINKPDYFDEVIVFVGASYFRAVAKNLRYGLSARGLALDTAADGPEEFPIFREFWIEKPAKTSKNLTIYALLDGPSVAGAYRFVVTPGTDTVVDTQVALFARKAVRRFGVAPLTSMFWHAENSETDFGDFRPRVHDSDGLLMNAGSGEWIWRPLRNPMKVEVAAFQDHDPKGFGLLQRERDFVAYQDLEAHYEDRPSTWVEPVGKWGPGSIWLIELPSDKEINDNIVAFWEPKDPPKAGESLELAYKLHWYADDPVRPPRGRTLATRVGALTDSDETIFVIDFGKGELAKLPPSAQVTADVSANEGAEIRHVVTEYNPYTKGWRVAFRLAAGDSENPIELRCFLKNADKALTETWSYRWTP